MSRATSIAAMRTELSANDCVDRNLQMWRIATCFRVSPSSSRSSPAIVQSKTYISLKVVQALDFMRHALFFHAVGPPVSF